jgi:Uma2 family endonuclease
MSTETMSRLLTAEEFFELPDPIQGGKMELVRGDVVTHMPVGGVHGKLVARIMQRSMRFLDEHPLGELGPEIGFVLQRNPDVVLAPDISFVAAEKLPGGALPEGFVEGAPTLAVEVVSPNDRDREVNEKVGEYLAHYTQRIWVVRPRSKTVTVFRPDNTARIYHLGETLTSEDAGFVADGFALPLDELFG